MTRNGRLATCNSFNGAPLGGYDESRLVAPDHTEQEVIERVDAEKLAASLPADLQRYEKARHSGAKSAKDVSKVLGVSVRTVRNYERRMKRKRRQKI
jgi:DNA-directed RNA polymerase specialized sigma24 family protein